MLDHVEYSFHARQDSAERLRRFVADASHELHTPLAAVSGSESARMTNMVQDLLLLARLDAGDTLNLREFPLAQVVITACSVMPNGIPRQAPKSPLP